VPWDWVLVVGFENRTGEPLFDGRLQYALERELSNSRFVNVVPRERVEEVLRMMKRPADTSIDFALAREICLRDGDIRALLTGRAEKLGSTYVFSVRLIQSKDGTTVPEAWVLSGQFKRIQSRQLRGPEALIVRQI
jgi:hypothetical protein